MTVIMMLLTIRLVRHFSGSIVKLSLLTYNIVIIFVIRFFKHFGFTISIWLCAIIHSKKTWAGLCGKGGAWWFEISLLSYLPAEIFIDLNRFLVYLFILTFPHIHSLKHHFKTSFSVC